MPRYQISHRTFYSYSSPVIQSNHLLHLEPRQVAQQNVVRHNLIIKPKPAWRESRPDYFGNPTTLISMEDEHKELLVHSRSEVEVSDAGQPDFMAGEGWERVAQSLPSMKPDVAEFVCPSRFAAGSKQLYQFALPSFEPGLPVLEGARRLMERIFTDFSFDNSTTDVATPVAQVLEQKSGVCQDFAHLQIAALRSLGLPARYVSGYILTHPAEGEKKLEGTDASHAWVQVWSPEKGWVDFDPTNNLVNSTEHITTGFGRDFGDVSPISGVLLGGGHHSVGVAVDVKVLPPTSVN